MPASIAHGRHIVPSEDAVKACSANLSGSRSVGIRRLCGPADQLSGLHAIPRIQRRGPAAALCGRAVRSIDARYRRAAKARGYFPNQTAMPKFPYRVGWSLDLARGGCGDEVGTRSEGVHDRHCRRMTRAAHQLLLFCRSGWVPRLPSPWLCTIQCGTDAPKFAHDGMARIMFDACVRELFDVDDEWVFVFGMIRLHLPVTEPASKTGVIVVHDAHLQFGQVTIEHHDPVEVVAIATSGRELLERERPVQTLVDLLCQGV